MTTSRQSERMKQTKKNMPPQSGRVSPPPVSPVMDDAEGLDEETVRVPGGDGGSSSNKGRKVCTGNFIIE